MQITPSQIFPSYSSDGNSITIALNDLVGLDAVEADAATGNGASVSLAIVDTIAEAIAALPDSQKPTKMTAIKGSIVGIGPNTIRQPYSFSFDATFDRASVNVMAES